MSTLYTARKTQVEGRTAWTIEFRHPMQQENGKGGKKVRAGLGNLSEADAEDLVADMNELLRDSSFWSLDAKPLAEKRFRPKVVEIFYRQWAPPAQDHRSLRDNLIPLPDAASGYVRSLLVGQTGAGKSSLLRQLLGSHPKRDRFPATSNNRTTTCEIEAITAPSEGYTAAVTFLSRRETEYQLQGVALSAILQAAEDPDDLAAIAQAFLMPGEMRFRLDYLLGAWDSAEDEPDPYAETTTESESEDDVDDEAPSSQLDAGNRAATLECFVTKLRIIALAARDEVEAALGENILEMRSVERSQALDDVQRVAEESDAFRDLMEEILQEIQGKFSLSVGLGKYRFNTTGWPISWFVEKPTGDRKAFLRAARFFTGNTPAQWGALVTPLVSGIRVRGPFFPSWAVPPYRHVFIDTEGLGHSTKTISDVPEPITSRFAQVDAIVLVESAKNALSSAATAKLFEAVASSGCTDKFIVAFTHLDAVRAENLKGISAKKAAIFAGVRNILENRVADTLTRETARRMLARLESNTLYLGKLNEADPDPARPELLALARRLVVPGSASQPALCFPEYSPDDIAPAVLEAAKIFRGQWSIILGFTTAPELRPAPWQTVKAMTRRYANGALDDYCALQPVVNLQTAIRNALSRLLDNPTRWTGDATDVNARALVIDRVRNHVSQGLSELVRTRLWSAVVARWVGAFNPTGTGSTQIRRHLVQSILESQVPVNEVIGDREMRELVKEIRGALTLALEKAYTETVAKQKLPLAP